MLWIIGTSSLSLLLPLTVCPQGTLNFTNSNMYSHIFKLVEYFATCWFLVLGISTLEGHQIMGGKRHLNYMAFRSESKYSCSAEKRFYYIKDSWAMWYTTVSNLFLKSIAFLELQYFLSYAFALLQCGLRNDCIYRTGFVLKFFPNYHGYCHVFSPISLSWFTTRLRNVFHTLLLSRKFDEDIVISIYWVHL